ncbi:PAS domain-containing protein [Streptomyces sp. NPDC003717]|uniref:PAS domain-containing protein n=1 Tax=Streptomyces sp. NPDC003717 TaxID=3154276 RepID=UPI0033B6E360
MSSPLSADRPAVDALISQARRLRGDVDAVRRDTPRDGADPLGRWRRALCELALHQLSDLDAHLAQLRDDPAPAPRTGSLLSRVGSAEWNLLTDEAQWSADLYGILGRDPADAPLGLDELPSLVAAEDRPKLTAMVTDCLVDARPVDGEFRVVRPDGTVRTVHMMGEPVLDTEGGTAAMWAVLRDVSELRRSQRAVSRTRDSLGRPARPAGAQGTVPPPWHGPLSSPLPARPGLDLAAVRLPPPAEGPRRVGWFDACALGDDASLLAVGDLTGPGTDPGRDAALLIGGLRGLAAAGAGVEDLPDRLARLVADTALPPPRTTVCCGHRPGTLVWARAGGPAPLLFRDGAGRALDGPGEAALRDGDLLVLHTGAPSPERLRDLLDLAPRLAGAGSAREGLRIVRGAFAGAGEVCVLVARVVPVAPVVP